MWIENINFPKILQGYIKYLYFDVACLFT